MWLLNRYNTSQGFVKAEYMIPDCGMGFQSPYSCLYTMSWYNAFTHILLLRTKWVYQKIHSLIESRLLRRWLGPIETWGSLSAFPDSRLVSLSIIISAATEILSQAPQINICRFSGLSIFVYHFYPSHSAPAANCCLITHLILAGLCLRRYLIIFINNNIS